MRMINEKRENKLTYRCRAEIVAVSNTSNDGGRKR
jgi:hypothetical protein